MLQTTRYQTLASAYVCPSEKVQYFSLCCSAQSFEVAFMLCGCK